MMVDMKIGRGILIKHHDDDQSSIISSEREREFNLVGIDKMKEREEDLILIISQPPSHENQPPSSHFSSSFSSFMVKLTFKYDKIDENNDDDQSEDENENEMYVMVDEAGFYDLKSSFLCSEDIIIDNDILINLLDEKYMKSHNMVGIFIPFSSHITSHLSSLSFSISNISSSSHQNTSKKNDFFISLSTISPTFSSSSSSHVNWMDISSHLNLPPSHDHLSHNLPSPPSSSPSQLSFSPSERSTIYPFLISSPPLFLSNHGLIVNVRS